jgi:hypothetical protein
MQTAVNEGGEVTWAINGAKTGGMFNIAYKIPTFPKAPTTLR